MYKKAVPRKRHLKASETAISEYPSEVPAILSHTIAQGRLPWDKNGAFTYLLEVSAFAKASRDKWRALAEKLSFSVREEQRTKETGHSEWNARFVALPASLDEHSLYLSGEVHPVDADTAHWTFDLRLVPNTTPPADMREKSDRVGGFPTMVQKLAESWPAHEKTQVSVTAMFALDPQRWISRIATPKGRPPHRSVVLSGGKVRMIEVSNVWRLVPPSGCVGTLSQAFGEKNKPFVMSGTGDTEVDGFSSEFLEVVEENVWKGVQPFLKAVQS